MPSPLRLSTGCPADVLAAEGFAKGDTLLFSAIGWPKAGCGEKGADKPFLLVIGLDVRSIGAFSSPEVCAFVRPCDGMSGFLAGTCSRTIEGVAVKVKGRDPVSGLPKSKADVTTPALACSVPILLMLGMLSGEYNPCV